jgi:hypothetical protein
MSTVTLPEKDQSGDIVLTFDYSSDMLPGETISSVSITAVVFLGFDSSPNAIFQGSPSLANSPVISQKVIGGAAGTSYKIRGIAATSQGRNLLRKAILPVTAD